MIYLTTLGIILVASGCVVYIAFKGKKSSHLRVNTHVKPQNLRTYNHEKITEKFCSNNETKEKVTTKKYSGNSYFHISNNNSNRNDKPLVRSRRR